MMKKLHVGIDVAKKFFDLHLLETRKDQHYDYNELGISLCLKHLKEEEAKAGVKIQLVTMEATGGYELKLAGRLQAQGMPVAIINPRRIRDYAKAAGKLAKTDKIDARVIAAFGEALAPPANELLDENALKLHSLVARRRQLVGMRVAESNRMEHADDQASARSIGVIVQALQQEISEIEKQIAEHIRQQPELQKKTELLKSVPGVGETTAAMLVTELPELGRANRQEIAALVGVAPLNRDSGLHRGKRMTGGGRRTVRSRFYMSVVVAIQHNPVIRRFYRHLLEQGKAKMTALVAAMRKLLVILNTMLKKNQAWTPRIA